MNRFDRISISGKGILQPYWTWALIALVVAATRLPEFFLPINRDSGLFAYGGWRILHGELPYVDFWDNKLPGVFYINALAMKLFGVSAAGLVVFQMIYVTATAWAFFAVASRFCGRTTSLIATLLFAFYHGSYGLSESGNYTETYIGLPVLAAVLLLLQWSREQKGYFLPLLAGALGMAAGLIKQPAAGIIPAMFLFVLFGNRRRTRYAAAGAMVVGAAAVAAAVVVWMADKKILSEAIKANIVFNRLYLIDAYTDGLAGGLWNLLRGLVLAALPLAGAAAAIVSKQLRVSPTPAAGWLLIPWLTFDLIGLAVGGRFYNHYFLAILPSTLILTAMWIETAMKSRRLMFATVAACLLFFFGPVWLLESSDPARKIAPIRSIAEQEYYALRWLVTRRWKDGATLPFEDAAKWVREHTRPSDTIYVWGWETRIGFLARRAFASRYLHMHPLGATGFDRDARIRELARDLEKRRPKYIIDGSALMPTTAPPLDAPAPPSTSRFFRLDGYKPVKEVVARCYAPAAEVRGFKIFAARNSSKFSQTW